MLSVGWGRVKIIGWHSKRFLLGKGRGTIWVVFQSFFYSSMRWDLLMWKIFDLNKVSMWLVILIFKKFWVELVQEGVTRLGLRLDFLKWVAYECLRSINCRCWWWFLFLSCSLLRSVVVEVRWPCCASCKKQRDLGVGFCKGLCRMLDSLSFLFDFLKLSAC